MCDGATKAPRRAFQARPRLLHKPRAGITPCASRFQVVDAGWSSPVARQAHNRHEAQRAERDERPNDAPAQAGAKMQS